MTLIETLTLTVGPAIAKSILKIWLKDEHIALDAASELVDAIKSRTTDVLAQQGAKRQFEAIGEKVAASLLPVFEAQSVKLDESGKTAVALAFSETLATAKIDASLLAERDIDPAKLAEHLKLARKEATRDFSEPETSLYDRILSEASERIVDIASQLPGFTEQTFAEVLKRENKLVEIANQILEELRRIREESHRANPLELGARFEVDYRHAVVRRLDELELFGVDLSSKGSKRHKLSVAYVTLSVQKEPEESADTPRTGEIEEAEPEQEPDKEDITAPVDKVLAESQRLLVRGLAGSGKTTLLRWIAVRSAQRSFTGPLSQWNETVPFYIRLSQFTETPLPRPEQFPSLVAPSSSDVMPHGWVHEQLSSGRGLVLIDGVDEVSETQRTDVREWLKDLSGTYKDARIIVTSRPHAVEEGWMHSEGFDDAELLAMELPDIFSFIDHWHEAVGEKIQEPQDKAELPQLAAHMKQEAQNKRAIRSLATSPLLCAVLCALNRDRRKQLPADRIELYEACCYMLLERRDLERRIVLRDYPPLKYRQKRALLEDLAYHMLQNTWPWISFQRMEARLALSLPTIEGLPQQADATSIRRYFVERSGLVRQPVPDQADFTHRTFQEFLAAQAAVNEGDIGVLLKNATDDQWREVIILAAGLANKKAREELINELLARGEAEPQHRHQLHMLAVATLETSVELSPAVKLKLTERLSQLVPPRNMSDAKALASAGELAVPYLARGGSRHGAYTASACIRALSLIGGDTALPALATYASDQRRRVLFALLKARDYFDASDFRTQVLSHIKKLQLDWNNLFEILRDVLSVEDLTTWTDEQEIDCSYLSHLDDLVKLSISVVKITPKNFGCLARLKHLVELTLYVNNGNIDLHLLRKLTTLQRLELTSVDPDLRPITALSNLTTLWLHNVSLVSDITPIGGLKELTDLHLRQLNHASDLSSLTHLPHLKRLEINGLALVDDFSPLSRVPALTHLTLWCPNRSMDLRPLAASKNLEHLIVYGYPDVKLPENVSSRIQVTSYI